MYQTALLSAAMIDTDTRSAAAMLFVGRTHGAIGQMFRQVEFERFG